jgi:hypothetical protein
VAYLLQTAYFDSRNRRVSPPALEMVLTVATILSAFNPSALDKLTVAQARKGCNLRNPRLSKKFENLILWCLV